MAVGKGESIGNDTIVSASASLQVRAIGIASGDSKRDITVWEMDEPEGQTHDCNIIELWSNVYSDSYIFRCNVHLLHQISAG